MALKISTINPVTGAVSAYHKIERVMTNFSGEGSIEIAISHYASEDIRNRLKAGEMAGSMGESNIYLPLGDTPEAQSFDREILYTRLKEEAPEYMGAEDV